MLSGHSGDLPRELSTDGMSFLSALTGILPSQHGEDDSDGGSMPSLVLDSVSSGASLRLSDVSTASPVGLSVPESVGSSDSESIPPLVGDSESESEDDVIYCPETDEDHADEDPEWSGRHPVLLRYSTNIGNRCRGCSVLLDKEQAPGLQLLNLGKTQSARSVGWP